MNLHLLPDDKFIDEFIALAEQSLLKGQNRYVVNSSQALHYIKSDVLRAKYGTDQFAQAVGDVGKYERIFIHFLTSDMCRFINQCSDKPKFIWIFWGGDLYEHIEYPLYDRATYRFCLRNGILRRKDWLSFWRPQSPDHLERGEAIKRISHILHYDKSEYDLIVKNFPTDAEFVFFRYPNHIQASEAEILPSRLETEQVKREFSMDPGEKMIILGNSGYETNNHLEILKLFAAKRRYRFKVIAPLSYGNPQYIGALIPEAKRMLGANFIPLLDFLQPHTYARILRSCDAGIFNAHRTQGGGNILALLGRKEGLHSSEGDTLRLPSAERDLCILY